jgi:hypothetical protein
MGCKKGLLGVFRADIQKNFFPGTKFFLHQPSFAHFPPKLFVDIKPDGEAFPAHKTPEGGTNEQD